LGDFLVVGASGEAAGAGRAYVYHKSSDKWVSSFMPLTYIYIHIYTYIHIPTAHIQVLLVLCHIWAVGIYTNLL
jgi:hypothetical protein